MQVGAIKGGFAISGSIDEFADFTLLDQGPSPLVLDVGGVTRINSMGVRSLLNYLKNWGPGTYRFANINDDFLDMLNMVPSILSVGGDGRVASAMLSLTCLPCDREVVARLDETALRELAAGNHDAFGRCDECAGELEGPESGSFSFALEMG